MTVVDWTVPFTLITPQGNLELNNTVTLPSGASGIFLLNPQACQTQIPLRATDNDVPQQDGEVTHERFWRGYLMTLGIVLMENTEAPACDSLLQEMSDYLLRFVRSYTRPPLAPDARVYWLPAGESERMIRNAVINEPYDPSDTDVGKMITFQLKSPYPYAWTQAETTTSLDATLTNSGTAEFWPVIRVYGPTSSFTITNSSVIDEFGNALQIIYSGTAIGGGSYAEINCFDGTIYLNGDSSNLSDSINFLSTDYFWLQVGENDISIVGAAADVKWQSAWA
jgi:hypothetical protein